MVLSANGCDMKKQLPLFRLGLGGRLGSGRQYTSWISIADEVGGIVHALATPALAGAVNLTAPEPVTNAELTKTLGRVLHRPAVLPVPRAALAVVLGRQLTDDMVLASQRALPARLQASGFVFRHPELEGALRSLLDRPPRPNADAERVDR